MQRLIWLLPSPSLPIGCLVNYYKDPSSGYCRTCLPGGTTPGDYTTATCTCAGKGYNASVPYDPTNGCSEWRRQLLHGAMCMLRRPSKEVYALHVAV